MRSLPLIVLALAFAVAGGVVGFAMLGRPGAEWLDVTSRPEFAASLAALRPVPACQLEYGAPHRGTNAEERQFGRVWATECKGEHLRVGVSVDAAAGAKSRFKLERNSADAPWTLQVEPTAAEARLVASALASFVPALIAEVGPKLARDREDMHRARLEHEAREADERAKRAKNVDSYR